MERKEAILSAILILCVMILFGCALTWEEEPQRLPEKDEVTGSVVWKATSTPTEQASFTPTCTIAPTATSTPEPTATSKPTATNTPKPTATNTPTPKVKVGSGVPGTYTTEANGTHFWKPWAWYTAITATDSPQWRLQRIAKTDENGLRYVTDPNGVKRFCIAMEPTWAGGTSHDIGRCVDLFMQDGSIIHCVLADTKRIERSLNGEGKYGRKGELAEFLCDGNLLNAAVKTSGTVSSLGGAFAQEAIEVWVYDLFITGFGG